MKKQDRSGFGPGNVCLYGLHAARAALANPRRTVHRAALTESAAAAIGRPLLGRVRHEIVSPETIARLAPKGALHQGVLLVCDPLLSRSVEEIAAAESETPRIVVVLDQIADPHNAGAILRSAAAFGVSAVVVQDRHSPPETGALAKAASGALDIVPYVRAVNIARSLERLAELGFWRIALTGDGDRPLAEATLRGNVCVVLGSEGGGIRRLVRERCDERAFIPTEDKMESLNVSNAAAIALYELRRADRIP